MLGTQLTGERAQASSLTAKQLVGVSRAFAHFLGLSNTAETAHRLRRLQENLAKEGAARRACGLAGKSPVSIGGETILRAITVIGVIEARPSATTI